MPDLAHFLTFAAATLILNLTPGPDMMYIIARSLGQGRRAGVVSTLGISAGCLFHAFAATVGIAAVLQSWPIAFQVVRYAGAAYLIYLGGRLIVRRRREGEVATAAPNAPLHAIFRQGVITNVLNPKVALFFLAFLPQFVAPSRGSATAQLITLSIYFIFSATLINLAVAVLSGVAGDFLRRGRNIARMERASGAVFIALGLRVGLARST
ncbi:MAG: LysE family translocator [Candidatus Acidiferrales bacterium]